MKVDPESCVIFVLLCKLFSFVSLPAERADNAHARQIFLRDCGENSLVFVADFKSLSDFSMEKGGITYDERHECNRDERELDVH